MCSGSGLIPLKGVYAIWELGVWDLCMVYLRFVMSMTRARRTTASKQEIIAMILPRSVLG